MSTKSVKKIDQKEYLKKYLSGDKGKKKKKKDKEKKQKSTVKIVDDDCFAPVEEIDEDLLLTGEDAPQIVGEYVEERHAGNATAKWRSITVKEECVDIVPKREDTDHDLWGRKATAIKKEFSPPRKKSLAKQRQCTPDMSPPRQRRSSVSPKKNKENSERCTRSNSRDASPPRRKMKSTNYSPKRKKSGEHWKREEANQRHNNRSREISPTRRSRKDSDSSPPRKKREPSRRSRSRDYSPQRRPRKNYETDFSKRQDRRLSRDQSPPRRSHKNQAETKSLDSDNSPPRRRLADSPQRVKIKKEALSPNRNRLVDSPRRSHKNQAISKNRDSDNYPPRRRVADSPQRIKIKKEAMSPTPPRKSRWGKHEAIERSPSPPPTHKPKVSKTLDGKKAGLQSAQSLKTETEERRREETKMFAKMSSDISGRDAEVQVRSTGRRGKRARDAAEEDPEVRRRKEEEEQKRKEVYARWGKGIKQIEDHKARRAEEAYESSKPLARYANDEDLDRHLREQERAEDPMLSYIRQKKKEREKESKVPTKPTYEGNYPENRFGIRPGYRWDGVDRSNGYEKKWFSVQSEKRAIQDEAYKYSVEDM